MDTGHSTRRAWLVAVAVVALIAAGCSGDGDSNDAERKVRTEPERVHVVSQNLLHGIACPDESDGCNLPGRVGLFVRQLEEHDCPAVVGIQEANEEMVALLEDRLLDVCRGDYTVVSDGDPGVDREVVITSLPVLGSRRQRLAGPLRTAYWVRVAADVGVVDFVTSHLASSSDDRPCDKSTCPAPCTPDGMINACQARQLVQFANKVAAKGSVVILAGDFNAQPDEPAVKALKEGGFVDAHLDAGNLECDKESGKECTSGRIDDALADLTDPKSIQTERIDYVFVGGDRKCRAVDPTGLFNAEPADPPGDGALVFPSDHTGVEATVQCATTEVQRASAPDATVPSSSTSTTAGDGGQADDDTVAAITESFRAVFDGDVTDVDQKLAALEDGDVLREYFIDSYEKQGDIAKDIRVRLDDVTLVDPKNAKVTYTLLLNGSAVLDQLPGAAVKEGDEWLVTRRTYCDVSTTGASEIPPPCQ